MNRDIRSYFAKWAATYDKTIRSPEGIFAEVFQGYEDILDEVVRRLVPTARFVCDLGAGTGNLSLKCHEAGLKVISVDPSAEMRGRARVKLPPEIEILAGDFLNLPFPDGCLDALASTWALHHVPDDLKPDAVREIIRVLNPQGKVVMADTAYENEDTRLDTFRLLTEEGKLDWLYELQVEYYSTLPTIARCFNEQGWEVSFHRMNRWVWLWEAVPKAIGRPWADYRIHSGFGGGRNNT